MMDNTIVLEGWLTKSPPEKRLWKSKWRQRWFVLKQSGQIPGQHLLEYYADNAYKKFKGRIDLDECEQVDAGLSLKFESGARSNKHVFDLKTSKRVYYLATKTEEEMNKWVACICSVCGLKMRDEEPENTGRSGNRYSPQPSAEKSPNNTVTSNNSAHLFASVSATSNTRTAHVPSATATNTTTSSTRINNNSLAASLNYAVPRSRSSDQQQQQGQIHSSGNNNNHIHKQHKDPSNLSEGSGPYIPISECHTGKPGTTAKENRPSNQFQAHPSPPLPTSSSNKINPITAAAVVSNAVKSAGKSNSNHVLLADEFYDVPRSSQTPVTGRDVPNWDTFPKDDKNRASSRSCSASFDAKANSSRTYASPAAASGQRTRCESGPGDADAAVAAGSSRSNPSLRRSATPTAEYMNSSDIPDFGGDSHPGGSGSKNPPPRPPKPATLSRSKIEPIDAPPVPSPGDCYDVPKPSLELSSPGKSVTEKRRRTSAPNANPPPSDHMSSLPDILDKTVAKPILSAAEKKALDSYDFPVSAKVQAATSDADLLDATVSVHPSARSDSGRHPYLNSAPGFKATKDSVFVYDYRPSLPTTSDDQIVNFSHSPGIEHPGTNDSGLLLAERSPRTPNSAFSEVTPPAVDRNLKPRRKGSDSDATASPTTPNPFLLKPAPDGKRHNSGSFGAVRGSPVGSASTLPSARNKSFTKNNGHSPQQQLSDGASRVPGRIAPQIIHSRDASTSEDDGQKTRSSDEQKKKSRPTRKPRAVPEGPELQYLDLDLESDNSSPRTPNSVSTDHHHSTSTLKESQTVPMTSVTSCSTLPSGSTSKSTVYKTVDFVKTDALNTLRHKVEEGHRNPQ